MTIIVGIKCKDGIALSCDSRTTDPTGVVRDDARKLSLIKFNDGNTALIAEAGNDDLSSRALEIITLAAKEKPLNDYRTLAEISQDAIVELKRQMRGQYQGSAEELQKHFESYSFELMIAHYFEGVPYIFTLDFSLGQAIQKKRAFVSIGCGWVLADFLLNPLDLSEWESAHALWSAVYAVEQVKLFDGRCGGPTRSAIIHFKNGKSCAVLAAESWMKDAVVGINRFSHRESSEWKKKVESAIKRFMARKNKRKEAGGQQS